MALKTDSPAKNNQDPLLGSDKPNETDIKDKEWKEARKKKKTEMDEMLKNRQIQKQEYDLWKLAYKEEKKQKILNEQQQQREK